MWSYVNIKCASAKKLDIGCKCNNENLSRHLAMKSQLIKNQMLGNEVLVSWRLDVR